MNLDQVLSAVRWIVTTIGGYFATKGTIGGDQVQLIGGAAAALASLGWSFFVHADSSPSASPSSSS